MKHKFDLSLYLVLDPVLSEPLGMVETVRRAVAGGITMVQLRHKHASTSTMIETGRALKAALAGTGVPLIVNDDIETACAIDADGVHIGQSDMGTESARQRIGKDRILGLSIGSLEEAQALNSSHLDYVGIGPIFPTSTKPGHPPAIGFEGLAAIAQVTSLPAVAIGGLKVEHVAAVFAAGVNGVAVVSAICGQPDPELAARSLMSEIRRARL
jgi:thiamine-phosphate pyrophosphorylase